MKAVIQRVTSASVTIDSELISQIGQGFMVLLGIGLEDGPNDSEYIIKKMLNLRVFSDEQGKMNKSIQDIAGEILLVSQFTLYADLSKGNRPSFIKAMPPDRSQPLYSEFVQTLQEQYAQVKTGIFGANMQIQLINDGPVTIILDSSNR